MSKLATQTMPVTAMQPAVPAVTVLAFRSASSIRSCLTVTVVVPAVVLVAAMSAAQRPAQVRVVPAAAAVVQTTPAMAAVVVMPVASASALVQATVPAGVLVVLVVRWSRQRCRRRIRQCYGR